MQRKRLKDSQATAPRKRLSTNDIPDLSTPQGQSMTNDEFRRINVFANEIRDDLDKLLASPTDKTPPATSDGADGSDTTTGDATPEKISKILHNTKVIVADATEWDFTDTASVKFTVDETRRGRGRIKAEVINAEEYDLSVGQGGSTGPTLNYAGASLGFVNRRDTHLLWFAGDNYSFDGTDGNLGLFGDKPSLSANFIIDNRDAPLAVNNPYFGLGQTVRIKPRITPLLSIWDAYTRDTLNLPTSIHTTRIEFKDSPTVELRVSPHATLAHAVEIQANFKEGSSVQNIRIRKNNANPTLTRPQINLIETNYTQWTLADDNSANEVDITLVPKISWRINAGAIDYKSGIGFYQGDGIIITENTTNPDEYRITITNTKPHHVSVGHGGSTGPTLNYAGAGLGFVNREDTHLFWFAGDNYSFDGTDGNLGLFGDKPSLSANFIVDNNDAPVAVNNPYLTLGQTVRIKPRITPLLSIWDVYTRDTLNLPTSIHTTRIEFKDSPTVELRVSPHSTLAHAVEIQANFKEGSSVQNIRIRKNNANPTLTRPQLNLIETDYTQWTLADDNSANEVDITLQPKLGFRINSGTHSYRQKVRFIAGANVALTENAGDPEEYQITITSAGTGGGGDTYTGNNIGGYVPAYIDTTGSSPIFTHNFRTFRNDDGTAQVVQDGNTIVIRSLHKLYAVANLGAGAQVYKNFTDSGSTRTFNIRSIVNDDGSAQVVQSTDTIIIRSLHKQYAITNIGTGAQVYKDFTDAGNTRTFNLRRINSPNNSITVTGTTDSIELTVVDGYSVQSLQEELLSEDNYTLVADPMRRLLFKHGWNAPLMSGWNAETFDYMWDITQQPNSNDTRVQITTINPLQGEHRNSANTADFTTGIGQRKFAFRDSGVIQFTVTEEADLLTQYRTTVVSASIIPTFVVEAENVGVGTGLWYKNKINNTLYFRTALQSGDIRITTGTNEVTIHSNLIGFNRGASGANTAEPYFAKETTVPQLEFKRHKGLQNITITQDNDYIYYDVADQYDLSVGHGGSTGPTLNYAGAGLGFVNREDTHLLWFAGDNYSFDGTDGNLGLFGDKPSLSANFIIDNNDAPITVNNPYLGLGQTVRIKPRITPLLQVWDVYTRDTLNLPTSIHTTRVECKDSSSIELRVSPHATLAHAVEIQATLKEGSSVQNIRIRKNNTNPVLTRPQINLIETNYTQWALADDNSANEVDITLVPKMSWRINAGAIDYKSGIGFYQGTGITITENTTNPDEYRITISRPLSVLQNGTAGLPNTVATIDLQDNLYDIKHTVQPLPGTPPTVAQVRSEFMNYNTRWDTPMMEVPGGVLATKTTGTNIWETLYFNSEVIEDTPNWIENTPTPFRWLFKPNDAVNYCWHIDVALNIISRDPTNNALPATLSYPELALFINGQYYSSLDIDQRASNIAFLRQYLMDNNLGQTGNLTDNATNYFLHGSDIIRLTNNSDFLEVKFRHKSGNPRYLTLTYGYIAIHKTGSHAIAVNSSMSDPQLSQQ